MLITLGMIQAGIWIHGHNVAVRAANAAADVGRGSYGSTDQAREVAADLASAGGLKDVVVSVGRDADSVNAVVNGRAPLIFDVGLGSITETASAPLERVSQPSGGFMITEGSNGGN
jgi:hypothetical protein